MSDTPRTDAVTNGYDRLAFEHPDALELMRTLERELAQAVNSFSETVKWVSVEERVPTDDSTVIVCTHDGYRGCGWYDRDEELWLDTGSGATFVSLSQNVTHWMPLPEAP
jgi:hypothetical protein